MGFKCDACGAEDAAVFCFGDQQVMCRACDARAQAAAKGAKKRERVGLQREAEAATCDICQEHKAVLFCSEDRALICRRCDLMIHSANEFVAKHRRYLLSGMTVGLKALDGAADEAEDGKSKKGYSLRNGGASGSKAAREPAAALASAAPAAPKAGLGSKAAHGSLPSLIDLPASAQLSASSGATLLPPFSAAEPSSRLGADGSGAGPSNAAGDPGSSSGGAAGSSGAPFASSSAAPFGGWGDAMDPLRHAGSDFTLAAELLGIPNVSNGFSAKDIDAAYIFDDDVDLDADLSALLEVPDLEAFQPSHPVVVAAPPPAQLPGAGDKRGSTGAAASDGVVPDLPQADVPQPDVNGPKRQRV